jgi:hypothetical protein
MKFTRGSVLVPITAAMLVAAPSAAMASGDGGLPYLNRIFDYSKPQTMVNTAKVWNGTDGTIKGKVALDFQYSFNPRVRLINDVVASSRCVNCGSIALGFQIALLTHPAPKIDAENKAIAYNETCLTCLTVALAYQFVVVSPLPLELSHETQKQLETIGSELDQLRSMNLPAAEVDARAAAQAEKVRSLLSADAAATNNPATIDVKRFADLTPS